MDVLSFIYSLAQTNEVLDISGLLGPFSLITRSLHREGGGSRCIIESDMEIATVAGWLYHF